MRACLFAASLLSALPLAAQTKHPFTFEDMIELRRVEEPVPSPDGKWVLFAAVDVDLKANTKTPHVWVVPLSQDAHVSEKQGDVGHPGSDKSDSIAGQTNNGVPHFSPILREVGLGTSGWTNQQEST
jgi:hypothetical protein